MADVVTFDVRGICCGRGNIFTDVGILYACGTLYGYDVYGCGILRMWEFATDVNFLRMCTFFTDVTFFTNVGMCLRMWEFLTVTILNAPPVHLQRTEGPDFSRRQVCG